MRVFSALILGALLAAGPLLAQTEVPKPLKLFAVEITTGPGWDKARPAHEQAHFKEHSAHLKKLRDQGRIRMGARYSEKGLIVLEAADEAEARALMGADLSMQSGTFQFSLAEMRVFYPGQVGTERKAP